MVKHILNIAYYEVLHILKDPILFLIVFVVPAVYAGIFGMVYYSAAITDIPVGIVNQDNSRLSRQVTEAFSNDSHFRVVKSVATYSELKKGMQKGIVRAGVVIPENFESRVSQHRPAELLTVYDGSNLIWGFNTRKNMMEVANQFSSTYTAGYLAGLSMNKNEIKNVMDTVSLNMEVWYNPTYSYVIFMFMGLMMMVIHQIGLLSVGLTVTREKERNCWIQYLSAPVSRGKIIIGKCLPYLVMNFFNYTLLLWISANLIHAKIEGSVLCIVLLGLLYDIIITFAGFFISVHAPNSLQVTRYLLLISVPLFMISGYTWPTRYIPPVLNALADLFPTTWMINGFRLATVKSFGLAEMMPTIGAMLVMAAGAVGLAYTFRKDRKLSATGLTVNCGNVYPRRAFVFRRSR